VSADEILVVAGPDLANLRNAKNLVDLLRASRPNDHHPRYCLNQVGIPKRPEISPADFAKALETSPLAVIPFEPQLFGPGRQQRSNDRRSVGPSQDRGDLSRDRPGAYRDALKSKSLAAACCRLCSRRS
jgi:hypothetical protein